MKKKKIKNSSPKVTAAKKGPRKLINHEFFKAKVEGAKKLLEGSPLPKDW